MIDNHGVCLTLYYNIVNVSHHRLSTLFISSVNIPKLFQDEWIGERSEISDVTGQFGLYSWCVGRWALAGYLLLEFDFFIFPSSNCHGGLREVSQLSLEFTVSTVLTSLSLGSRTGRMVMPSLLSPSSHLEEAGLAPPHLCHPPW